ncbi:MAG: IPT/TIG domain-containing protein [Syntrophomonadaceae bacterium]|nr:IPT/TIG domain-containing protein [Syntrophomonadaceae bacterium]
MKKRAGRRLIAILLVFTFLLTLWPYKSAWAEVGDYDPTNYKVNSIKIGKTFNNNRELIKMYIDIQGVNLRNATVKIDTYESGLKTLTQYRTENDSDYLKFEVAADRINDETDFLGQKIVIGSYTVDINENTIPKISEITRRVANEEATAEGTLVIKGNNMDKIGTEEITAQFGRPGNYVPFTNNTEEVNISPVAGTALGLQNIVFIKNTVEQYDFPGDANQNIDVNLEIRHTYEDQFRLYETIDLDGIEMLPNRGQAGDKVYFRRGIINESYDVYFLRSLDGTDPYSVKNKGVNPTLPTTDQEDNIDIFSVEVPKIAVGEYYVVLTNRVDSGDPDKKIGREYILLEKFNVIDADTKMKIIKTDPNHGPTTGSKTTIFGEFFGTLNIPEFEPTKLDKIDSEVYDATTLKINYGPGIYNKGKSGEKTITSASRFITVWIGEKAYFCDNATTPYEAYFSKSLDEINVRTYGTSDMDSELVKDVVVETVTTLYYEGGSIVFKERAELSDGYTYISGKEMPEINSIIPDKIQVEKTTAEYQIPKDLLITIHGKNFMITKYKEDNKEIVRFPRVELGKEIILDKNGNNNIKLQLFNDSGQVVDGTEGNDLGSKLQIIVPAGTPVEQLGKTYLKIVNPVRNSNDYGLSAQLINSIEFLYPAANIIPSITSVIPDIVTINGGEEVTIKGSNFRQGVMVVIDGEEVTGIERNGTGEQITFKAPPGREGETQLQVLNPEGGIAVWPFKYVKTYTDPKITDFSPKSGSTGTLVVVTGQNFLKPDSAAGDNDILKLIGTRVFLDNKDINDYNKDDYKHIELVDYANNSTPLIKPGAPVQLADYYDSVLLYVNGSNPKQYYTLDKEADGTVKLSDGISNTYIIESSGETLKARKVGGSTYDLSVNNKGLTIKDSPEVNLIMQTPYHIDDNGKITGKHVRVINKSEIQFTVPILAADGYYDLKVVNPDTKSDSRTGNQGFYYFSQPQSNPVIDKIVPSEGSTLGGYSIEIHGSDFKDYGQKKSRVIINGLEVRPEDTEVSIEGNMISVVVPSYPGDLWKDKGTGSLTVPVVVINPDGASAVKADGFTYIVPTSYPEIIKVVPAQGSAAGGDIIEITGRDFRFYEPFDDKNRDRMRQEGEPYTDLNGNESWDDFRGHIGAAALRDLYKSTPQDYSDYDSWFEGIVRPVLPKVYFNRTQVKVLEFSDGYLKILSPANPAGKVEVMVVNNDSGISNKVPFTFEGSQPRIDKIIPAEGSKFGRENVEVYGSGFFPSSIEVYDSLTTTKTKEIPLLRFGAISNRDIPRDKDNSGRIDSEHATVKLDGGLTIAYDASQDGNSQLKVELNANNKIYSGEFSYDNTVKYIDLSLLSAGMASEAANYSGYELVRVEVQDRRLIVERGYSPSSRLERVGQLIVVTPSYYTVGSVPVTLVNPDGETASSSFEYKNPASSPVIHNITRDGKNPENTSVNGQDMNILRMNYQGKSEVAILGEDFRENARIQIADILEIKPEAITYTLPTKLTFTMPEVNESQVGKLHRVIVINEDGGVACSDKLPTGQKPIYIQFTKGETSPQIGIVTPTMGPATGGTVVTITGKDFREKMEGYADPLAVYFGGAKVAESDVKFIDYKTVQVRTPANSPGSVAVRVENPDGEMPVPEGEFTYISTPKITGVESTVVGTNNQNINSISAEGGQEIKIKGSGFMAGCKVVFNPVTKKADAETGGEIIYKTTSRSVGQWQSNEIDPYVLTSGNEGTDVKVLDADTIIVKTPPGKVDTGGIIIVNPDKGASDSYDGIHYDFPEVQAPLGVVAEIIIDEYNDIDHGIKIHWNAVEGAREYEIYVVEGGQVDFVGSTQLTSYVYTDLQRRTTYKFIVKAVGDFGSSQPSAESNEVRTGTRVGAPDYDGGISDNTQMRKQGNTALVTLGTKDHNSKPLLIDLTRGDLAGAEEVVLSIPARAIVGRAARDIEIRGSNFSLKMNPAVFGLAQVKNNSYRDDAGIRFKIAPAKSSNYLTAANHLSPVYALEANFFQGGNSSPINYLATNMSLMLDVDTAKASMRRLTKATVCRYDEHNSNWMTLEQRRITGGAVPVSIKQLGMYTVLGDRN